MIKQLVAALAEAGVETDAEAIADALWLARVRRNEVDDRDRQLSSAMRSAATEPRPPDAEPHHPNDGTQAGSERANSPGPDRWVAGQAASSPDVAASSITLRKARALPGALELGRALRPLKQRHPSKRSHALDAEATVDYFCDTGILMPVMRPGSERWFDVDVLVDASPSMTVWQDTGMELVSLLERHGAFRKVRHWTLEQVDGRVGLSRPGVHSAVPQLVNPDARRLTMVVTDCISPMWYRLPIWDAIREWGLFSPVVLITMLPPRLWSKTALGSPEVTMRSHQPGAANRSLDVTLPWWWPDTDLPQSIMPVPVITLQADSVATWAHMIMGAGGVKVVGVFATPRVDKTATRSGNRQPDAEERVQRFRVTVSPIAYRLAIYLSAALYGPWELALARVVQEAMLPDSSQLHLAEVVVGGLVRRADPITEPGGPMYEFFDGVANVLQRSLTGTEAFEVLQALAGHIERETGRSPGIAAMLLGESPPAAGAKQFADLRAGAANLIQEMRLAGPEVVPERATDAAATGPAADAAPPQPEETAPHAADAQTTPEERPIHIAEDIPARPPPLSELVEVLVQDRLPRMAELNPYILGSTPSKYGNADTYGQNDKYVPRAQDMSLADALRPGRLVILTGRAKAGKTRTAFEVLRGHRDWAGALLAAPTPRSLHLLARHPALGSTDPLVIWLDDLQRFLLPTGELSQAVVSRLIDRPGPTVLVATLRAEQRELLRGADDEMARDLRMVLDNATWIELSSIPDPAERARAAELYPEIGSRPEGLAEMLAGAPEVLRRYRDAATADPPLHIVVQICVDWVRCGLARPIPEAELVSLARDASEESRPDLDLTDDEISEALRRACRPIALGGQVALLRAHSQSDGSRGYEPFEDLVAADDGQGLGPPRPVAETTWRRFLDHATDEDALHIGIAADQHDNVPLAVSASLRAAEAGHVGAQYYLGVLLAERLDPPELVEARTWWTKAAQAGNTDAQNSLGLMLAASLDPPELAEARAWLTRAAGAGSTDAQVNLGVLLATRLDPPELAEARAWLTRAAEAGSTDAQVNLGVLLATRLDPPELAEARVWYTNAAEAGHTEAQYNLGTLLATMIDPPELAEARTWWTRAAEAGDVEAQQSLTASESAAEYGMPAVTGLSPTSGPVTGGAYVAVTGSGFTRVTEVRFGMVAASNLVIASDTDLTVTSPATAAVGPVDVTVTTPAGTSATTPADVFTYIGSRGIFVSYRRQETNYLAGRLYDRLADRFGEGQVFIDVNTIEPGVDFAEEIVRAVAACQVLLAIIGPGWLTVADERGRRRLDDPDDIVRLEIETALARGVRVIPILVDGAVMPRPDDLPESLAGLTRCNALLIGHESFRNDAARLVASIERVLVPDAAKPRTREQRQYATPEGWTERKTDEKIGQEPDSVASVAKAGGNQETQPARLRRPKVFLCYRREDTQGFARGIYGSLANKYGYEQVFRDIDPAPAGVRFSTWIESRVSQCDVMIVLVGDSWLSAKDRAGQRRLDMPEDWVRQEIEVALRHDIPIIPVRVQGAPMPSEYELPPSIVDLAGFQSAEVTDSRWDFDVGLLIQAIDNLAASN